MKLIRMVYIDFRNLISFKYVCQNRDRIFTDLEAKVDIFLHDRGIHIAERFRQMTRLSR